jgi:phospholipid/cholesterol/gamma-HCH transport system substrate-binding protein
MAKKAVEFKVGIVVIIGVVMLVGTILWLQGFQFNQSHNTIKVLFKSTGGLKKGDFVSVSGVNMGKVSKITLEKDGVLADLKVSSDAYLHSDAKFIIKNYGIMGERYIYIEPGTSGKPLDLSKVQPGEASPGTAELIGLFGETIQDVQKILNDIKSTVASEKNLENLVDLAATLNDLSLKLNTFFLDNRGSIKQTFSNLENVTGQLSKFVDTSSYKVDSTLTNFAQASASLNKLADSLEVVTRMVTKFMQGLEEGKGTLGLLSEDPTLYQDIKKTIRSMEGIIEDIRHDPKKYLNVEVKIF